MSISECLKDYLNKHSELIKKNLQFPGLYPEPQNRKRKKLINSLDYSPGKEKSQEVLKTSHPFQN